MDLSIIILNWNSIEYLKRCLLSIHHGICPDPMEIIIVDNHSEKELKNLREIEEQFACRTICLKRNRGVAGGRNVGIRASKGKFILLLDVDTIVFPTAIHTLIEYMQHHKRCGLIAPKLVSPNGEKQYSCRKFPTLMTKLTRRLPRKIGDRFLIHSELRQLRHNGSIRVDYAIGACQMLRKDVIETIGLLDEKIFYGPEDIDYCLRIWQAGYHVIYCPESVVVHYEQRITHRKMFNLLSLKHLIGLFYYFYKHGYLFSTRRIYRTIPYEIDSGIRQN